MIKREHKRRKEFSKRFKSTEKYIIFFKWREETRANKPRGRAETGATSIPMKYQWSQKPIDLKFLHPNWKSNSKYAVAAFQ